MLLPSVLLLLQALSIEGALQPRQLATIPNFVTKYAPLVYLDQNERYYPSDIQAQLDHTYPALNYSRSPKTPAPFTLSDLAQLNAGGNCSTFDNCNIFLTSKDNVTENPSWLYGVLPDPVTFETIDAKSCAIIVNDHGDGTVDAFYMYFYAINLGPTVLNQVVGNHVGDWEHSMVRFKNGMPEAVWLSQHEYGQAFSYTALSKNGSRPIIYSAIGSHANFAVTGTHGRLVASLTINDYTSQGPPWDPTLSAYYYAFTPTSDTNGTLVPSDSSTPISWLYFLGRWGDKQYPDSDPVQVNLLNLNVTWKYETGPTGPLDKGLDRKDTCPDVSGTACTTFTVLPSVSGSSIPATVTRSTSSGIAASSTASSTGSSGSTTTGTAGTTASATGSAAGSANTSSPGSRVEVGLGFVIMSLLVVILN